MTISGFEPEPERRFAFDDIRWHDEPTLRDDETWGRNMEVMRLLLEHGKPTRIIDNTAADNIPVWYEVEGVPIEFLPDWPGYKVGRLWLEVPESAEVLASDLEAAKYVATRTPEAP